MFVIGIYADIEYIKNKIQSRMLRNFYEYNIKITRKGTKVQLPENERKPELHNLKREA